MPGREGKKSKRVKNKINNGRSYYRETYGSPIESGLFYSGLLFLALAFSLKNIVIDNTGPLSFGISAVIMLGLAAMLHILELGGGYALEENGIYFKYRFVVRKLLYKDIKCIIIANSSVGERIKNTPCVVMIGGETEKILNYCMNSKRLHVLSMEEIREELAEEIGYYGLKNFWKMFGKGSCAVYDYGFEWNKGEMHKVLNGFSGDYYVAASVIDCRRKKYDEIVKEYGFDKTRIHIIDDSTCGIYKWHS